MATRRSSFEKRERDKARKAKQAAKRERRIAKGDEPDDESDPSPSDAPEGVVDEQAVLDELARLHARYDDGEMDLDEFEERRTELLARLTIS